MIGEACLSSPWQVAAKKIVDVSACLESFVLCTVLNTVTSVVTCGMTCQGSGWGLGWQGACFVWLIWQWQFGSMWLVKRKWRRFWWTNKKEDKMLLFGGPYVVFWGLTNQSVWNLNEPVRALPKVATDWLVSEKPAVIGRFKIY